MLKIWTIHTSPSGISPHKLVDRSSKKNYKKTHNLQKGWTGLTKYKNFGEGEGIRMSVYTTKIFLFVLIRNNKITIPSQHFL